MEEKEVADGGRGKKKSCIAVARAVLRIERIQHIPYRRPRTHRLPTTTNTDKSLRNHGKVYEPVLIKVRDHWSPMTANRNL